MSNKKSNLGRAIYDMFGVGKEEEPEGELGGETGSADFFPVRDESSDLYPPRGAAPSEAASERPVEDFRVERAIPVHTYEGTYLAAGTMLRGILTARGDVEIAGDFEGEIIAKGKVTLHSSISSKITAMGLSLTGSSLEGDVEVSGDVTVNDQSSILGNVRAENMVCSGKIKGDLDIQDNLVLDSSAEIDGSIKADTMSVSRGAKITGTVEMRNAKRP